MMVGAFRLRDAILGMIEASTTRRPSMPWTRHSPSTTGGGLAVRAQPRLALTAASPRPTAQGPHRLTICLSTPTPLPAISKQTNPRPGRAVPKATPPDLRICRVCSDRFVLGLLELLALGLRL